jgi:hypothetical protein
MRHQYGDTAGSCNKFVSINYQLCSAQHRMTLPHRGHYESASRLSRVSAALLISMTSASANRTPHGIEIRRPVLAALWFADAAPTFRMRAAEHDKISGSVHTSFQPPTSEKRGVANPKVGLRDGGTIHRSVAGERLHGAPLASSAIFSDFAFRAILIGCFS